MTASCATCKYKGIYLRASGELGPSICRRNPPVVHAIIMPGPNGLTLATPTSWPEINDAHWCGEYAVALAGLS